MAFSPRAGSVGSDELEAKEPRLPAMPQSRGYWNASKVCTKASSMILGKVLAELTNTPDLLYSDEHAAFRKFGDNADADDEMPEWANEASGAHKDSTSDAEHEHRERVTWKKMKDRPGHHRRYQTRRQKREPGAERTSEPPMVPLVAGAVKPPMVDVALSHQ
mmetsp:Transcript_67261/g.157808  ORF Transcript_67261/g.157808 Transcript_67261/m.157808 type:complete len:162 (-) Transcript_67261:238-723(-)